MAMRAWLGECKMSKIFDGAPDAGAMESLFLAEDFVFLTPEDRARDAEARDPDAMDDPETLGKSKLVVLMERIRARPVNPVAAYEGHVRAATPAHLPPSPYTLAKPRLPAPTLAPYSNTLRRFGYSNDHTLRAAALPKKA